MIITPVLDAAHTAVDIAIFLTGLGVGLFAIAMMGVVAVKIGMRVLKQ